MAISEKGQPKGEFDAKINKDNILEVVVTGFVLIVIAAMAIKIVFF